MREPCTKASFSGVLTSSRALKPGHVGSMFNEHRHTFLPRLLSHLMSVGLRAAVASTGCYRYPRQGWDDVEFDVQRCRGLENACVIFPPILPRSGSKSASVSTRPCEDVDIKLPWTQSQKKEITALASNPLIRKWPLCRYHVGYVSSLAPPIG
jgi:hypothetical protein